MDFGIPPVFSTCTGELERMNVVSVSCGKRQFNTCNAQTEVAAVDTAEKESAIIYMTTAATMTEVLNCHLLLLQLNHEGFGVIIHHGLA